MVLVIGFVGGFLERLVPDLLVKRNAQTGDCFQFFIHSTAATTDLHIAAC
jgi:hypothetical protein